MAHIEESAARNGGIHHADSYPCVSAFFFPRRTRTGRHMSSSNTKSNFSLQTGLLVSAAALIIAGCGGGGGGGGSGNGPGAPPPTAIAPSIVTQPAPATVADGALVQFSITATGDAPLTYQWLR